jgi:hypothetical protein
VNAAFTATVVRYCLGAGRITELGPNKRLWLEISRCETERIYLGHQLRLLRKHHDGPVLAKVDPLAGGGRYDRERLRLMSPQLARANELLSGEGGERRIGPETWLVAGTPGLAALWLDQGRWLGRALELRLDWSASELELLASQIQATGSKAHLAQSRQGRLCGVHVLGRHVDALASAVRPYVHRSMRHRLWPGDRR